MAMYEGIRVKIKVKEKWLSVIDKIANGGCAWDDILSADETIKHLCNRLSDENDIKYGLFIPRNGNKDVGVWNDSEPWSHTFQEGIWEFECCIKAGTASFGKFIHILIKYMVSEVYHLEYKKEEWLDSESVKYKLKNSELVEV